MNEIEYRIEETPTGAFVVRGPIMDAPARFEVREKALAFCRYAIGAKAGGGFIRVQNADGSSSRDFFQGSCHLTQSSSGRG
jgi:hypothetical protein